MLAVTGLTALSTVATAVPAGAGYVSPYGDREPSGTEIRASTGSP